MQPIEHSNKDNLHDNSADTTSLQSSGTTHEHYKKHSSSFPKSISTPVAILLAALLISLSHIAYAFIITGSSPAKSALPMFNGKVIGKEDFATEKIDSAVIVVEYSDTECPYCAQLHPTMKKLQDEYGSKVSFVYRYFPLTQIHPNAFDEAQAVHCVGKIAGAQKRVDYIREMFTYKIGKQNMTLPKGGRELLAKNIGVDAKKFNECMAGQEGKDVVNTSIQDGIAAGVEGTPATFILIKTRKGYEVASLIPGARPYEYFKAVIDDALSR